MQTEEYRVGLFMDMLFMFAGSGFLRGARGGMGLGDDVARAFTRRAPGRAAMGPAHSAANAARLRNRLASQEIAGGHAFEKHVLTQGEFGGLGIRTRRHFAEHIENVMNNPSAVRQLQRGRTAYWDDATSTVVIRNPSAADGGTAFRPTRGRQYFEDLE